MQVDIKHPHAKSAWVTIRVDRSGNITTRLIVETDLNLNAVAKDYNKPEVDTLLAAVQSYLVSHKHIDSADIEPIGQP